MAARKGVADASPVVAAAAAEPSPALQQPIARLDGNSDPACAAFVVDQREKLPNTARAVDEVLKSYSNRHYNVNCPYTNTLQAQTPREIGECLVCVLQRSQSVRCSSPRGLGRSKGAAELGHRPEQTMLLREGDELHLERLVPKDEPAHPLCARQRR